jgi:hypothetical protein
MLRVLKLMIPCLALSGCASTIGTFYTRPVVEDSIGETISTVSLSSDRRTVIVAHSLRDGHTQFCAEPPPDTASGIKASMDSTSKFKGDEIKLKDDFLTSVTVLSARNAPLDAFRTGVFTLCQFYLIGAVDKGEVKTLFTELIKSFEKTQAAIPKLVVNAPLPAKNEHADTATNEN